MRDTIDIADRQTPVYVLMAIVFAIIVLMLTLESTIIPFIILLSMGFAILYNFGTNIFFGEISYVTESLAAVLQLGVTMDYSIFLLHRFDEECEKHDDKNQAMANAIQNTAASIFGSSLTTVAGFLAICAMELTIGKDIGIVMAKGVILGLLSVITILPALMLVFDKLIHRFSHKTVLPEFKGLSNLVTKHYKVFIILAILLFIPAFYGERHNEVYYNIDESLPDDIESVIAFRKLKNDYNMMTTHMILVSDDTPNHEMKQMVDRIEKLDGIERVISYEKFLGPGIPENFIPQVIKDKFQKGGYKLVLINSRFKAATDEENAQIDAIEKIVKGYDEDALITGEGVLTKDLIKITDTDFKKVNIISIIAIFVIVAIVFTSIGNNQVVTYIALPGLKESLDLDKNIIDIPEYLSITADVVDFEMSPIIITATSELPEVDDFESAGDFDELLDGIDKIVDASEKLSEATGKLLQGQLSLSDGIEQFATGLNKVNTGAHSLNQGAKSLKDGVNASYEGSKEINNGVNKLSQSAGQLGAGYTDLGNGVKKFSSSAEEFSEGAVQVAEGISTIPEKTGQMSEGMNNIVSSTEQIVAGQEKLTEGINKSTKAIEEIKKGKEKELKVVELLLKGLDGLDGAVKGLGKVPGASGIAEKMAEGLAKQRMALEGLVDSSNQLIVGLTEVEEGLKEAEEASGQLSSNLGKVNQGQKNLANGIGQLAEGTNSLTDASSKLVEGSKGLSEGAAELQEGSSKANEGTAQFVEGSKALSAGSEKLTNGLGQLNAGAGELYNGSLELAQGTEQLAKGSLELKDGSNKLADGTREFDENMKKFHNEGIMEIKNRVNESDLDIDSIIETKDRLVDLSKEYNSFTGLGDNMEGSVKFVMKTEEIKGKEEKETIKVETKAEEKSGFIAWVKGLFKKNK